MLENLSARRIVLALMVLAGVALLGGYGVAMRARPHATAISLESPAPSAAKGRAIFVHVGGAVAHPGLYDLGAGARVNDAVEAAGGATEKADLNGLNLAAKVKDGDKVLVPSKVAPGEAGPAPPGAAAASGGLVNLNAATAADLEELPGIGPAIAERIITYRTEHGGFRRVEDLMDVPGIGPKTFESLKDHVTV